MQDFKTHQSGISLISVNVDIVQILDDLQLQYKFEDDYVVLINISRDDVERLIDHLPYDMDYDVFDHIPSEDGEDDERFLGDNDSDFIDLYDTESNEFTVILYLYNLSIDDDTIVPDTVNLGVPDNEIVTEVKRRVKVNSKGKRRIKMQCRKGFKWTGTKCEKISGAAKTAKRRSIRKAVRTKKAKGSGFRRIVNIKTKKANRKRKSMGLRRK